MQTPRSALPVVWRTNQAVAAARFIKCLPGCLLKRSPLNHRQLARVSCNQNSTRCSAK
nr:MAG TPA_asm: hypothetical protein [Caudoviricetes sp.]